MAKKKPSASRAVKTSAGTKKKTAAVATTRSRKTQPKHSQSSWRTARTAWLVAAVLLIGIFAFVGYKLHIFGSAQTVSQRFPGDPNPLKSGKAYFGLSGSNYLTREKSTGKPLSIHRTYAHSWDGRSAVIKSATEDTKAGRLPWVSIKVTNPKQASPNWAAIASGQYDTQLDQFLKDLDNVGGPVWLTVHHEMENDTGAKNFTAADYRNMQKHVRARMNAVNTKHIALAPIFGGYSWDPGSHRNPADWYVAGVWDFIGVDHYTPGENLTPVRQRWLDILSFADNRNLPVAVGEWGVRDTSGKQEQDFWDWNFKNKKDVLGMSWFDSGVNCPSGKCALTGGNLTTWIDIAKNDNRVMRVKDLGSNVTPPPSGDTTKPKVAITAPADGATVSGVVRIDETASDNVGVKRVDTYVDSTIVKNDTDASDGWWTRWGSTKVSDGTHTIRVNAFDAAGNEATVTRKIVVKNNQDRTKPSVAFEKPAVDGVKLAGVVQLQVSASDNVAVTRVDFYADGAVVKNDADATDGWLTKWNTGNLKNGTHTVKATAYDAAGNSSTVQRSVNIQN